MAPRKPDPQSLEGRLRAIALSYPSTTEDFPWGERAIKVAGKAFLFMRGEEGTVSFSVKLPVSRAEALDQAFTEPTHYGLGKHGWVTSTVDSAREVPLELFREWIDESFRAVAPKRVIAQLDSGSTAPAKSVTPSKKPKTRKRLGP
ncbi:MAG: MmcQ/YjbR family DNA-binding protein [Gemmatimonadaceae bacterium]